MGTTILEFGNCRLIKYEGKNEIMFCGNCGKQIPDQSAFCPECGTSVRHKESHPVTFENNTEDSGIKKIKCPYCGGHNLQSVSEIVTVTSTTGGGYSGSKGCLGLLLFGPFGLLCGNCGNAQKTEVQNNTKLFWVCGDCGQKFENIDNMQTEIAQKENNIRLQEVVVSVCVIIGAIFVLWETSVGILSGGFAIFGILIAAEFFFVFLCEIQIQQLAKKKQEYVELKRKSMD